MIFSPADGMDVDGEFPRDADHAGVHAVGLADPGTTVLGTEDEMNVIAGIGVRHDVSPLKGLGKAVVAHEPNAYAWG